MKNKGQVLIEVTLSLILLVIILGTLINFLILLQKTSKYQSFNQSISISGFEKYRNALISLSKTDWPTIDSLTSNTNYYIYASGSSWMISPGKENVVSGNESFFFSFRISNYTTNTIKFVTTTAEYLDLIIQDYFLLPKLNTNL